MSSNPTTSRTRRTSRTLKDGRFFSTPDKKKAPANINGRDFAFPEAFSGTITVDSLDFDEAELNIHQPALRGEAPHETIDLITGKLKPHKTSE